MGCGPPQLLDEVFPFLDHVDCHLQRGLLLLAEALDEVLDGLHRLGVHVVQQLLLQLLQPCPQLQTREGTVRVLERLGHSHGEDACGSLLPERGKEGRRGEGGEEGVSRRVRQPVEPMHKKSNMSLQCGAKINRQRSGRGCHRGEKGKGREATLLF